MTITHTGSSYSHDYRFSARTKREAMKTAWCYWNEPEYRCADIASLDYDPTEAALIRETKKRCVKMLKHHKITREEMQAFCDEVRESREHHRIFDQMNWLISTQNWTDTSNETVMLNLWKYADSLKGTDAYDQACHIMNGYFRRRVKTLEMENAVKEMKRKLENGKGN